LCKRQTDPRSGDIGWISSYAPDLSKLILYFTGRSELLNRLSNLFAPRRAGGQRREFLLYGMGGVGKSQIATRFSEVYVAK
jgi:Cdc6-like AAA superfamily ATPase